MTFPWHSPRIRISFPVVLILISVLQVSCGIGQEINWYPDLNSATKAASAQNKLILLHFTADWCRPCKTLESFVFSNPAVQRSFASNVIAVKVDVEENPDLVQQYGVSKVPYDVALTTSGRVVSRRQSPIESSGYNKMLSGFQTIISSLASGKNPGAAQNLDELKKLMRNESPRFEGQTTSFVPDAPKHQAPVPSLESAELNRKSKVVNNPFIKTPPPSPQHVANAFHGSQKPESQPDSRTLAVVPSFIPNPVAAVDHNQFAPAKSEKLVLPVLARTPESDTGPATVNPTVSSSKKVTNQFAAKPVRTKPMVDKNQFALPPRTGLSKDSASEAPQKLARTQEKISNSFVNPGTANANGFQPPNSNPAPNSSASSMGTAAAKHESRSTERLQSVSQPQKPQLALQGKCPVTLLTESQWVDGDPRWGCVHRNRTYLFASDANLKRFQSDPDGFSPILAGFDPVVFHESGTLADGLEEHGVFMGKTDHQRVVLFSGPETRARFKKDPKKYLNTVRQAMQTSSDASSLMR